MFDWLRRKAQTNRDEYVRGTIRPSDVYGYSRAPERQNRAIRHLIGYVYAAAMLNARSVASQPLRLYTNMERRGLKSRGVSRSTTAFLKGDQRNRPAKSVMNAAQSGDVVEIYDHPILDLLHSASPFIDGYQFTVLRKLLLQATGNEYLHPVIGPLGYPIEIHILPSQFVRINPVRDERIIESYTYGHPPSEVTFQPDEVLHNKIPSVEDPLYGVGWVTAAEASATLLEEMDGYELKLFENMARPDWGIFLKDNLNEVQWNRMVAHIDENMRGNQQAGRPYIFEGGSDAKPLQFSPRDLAFSDGELRKVESIAAISGVPVSLLRANDPNLASAEVGFASYMRDTIHPYLVADCEFLNQQLVPLFGDLAEGMFLAYDNPVAEDVEQQSRIYLSEVNSGVRTVNEARSEIGLDPVEDGDVLRFNGIELSQLGGGSFSFTQGLQPAPAPAPAAQQPAEEKPAEQTPPAEKIENAALNGAQIQQLLEIVKQVNLGEISLEAGRAVANAAFAGIPESQISEIFAGTFKKGVKKYSKGDFVKWTNASGFSYVGKVRRVKESGDVPQAVGDGEATKEDPVVFVQVYQRMDDGSYKPSDRDVPVQSTRLSKTSEPEIYEGQKAVSAEVKEKLKKKVKEHNEEVGDAKSKRATLGMLTTCYERGIGAYQTNPASVKPTVASAEQWAMGRVNGLLHALKTGKFKNKPYDTDLLPDGHPHAGDEKSKKSQGQKSELPDYKDYFTTLEEAQRRADELGCEGTHTVSGERFGYDGTLYMPCETHEEYEAVMAEGEKKYDSLDFRAPASVREEAERGLEWRKEFDRGGTEVGVARARDISNGEQLSPSTIRRMVSFFARHEVDKQAEGFDRGDEGYPSAGRIAWALWGGDAGKAWAEKLVNQMDAEDGKSYGKDRGQKVSRRDGESIDDCVSRGISVLMEEGYDQDQATAIAYSQCGARTIKCCTGLEPGIIEKSLEAKEDWHPEQKAARRLVEEVDETEVGDADEQVQRTGEPVTPATQIARNVSKVLAEQQKKVLRKFKDATKSFSRSDLAELLLELAKDQKALEDAVFEPMLKALTTAHEYAEKEIGTQLAEAAMAGVNDEAVKYARDHSFSFAQQNQAATIRQLRALLASSIENRESPAKIAQRLEQSYIFDRKRANVIARTETARAFVEGEMQLFEASPNVKGKKWLLAPRACPFCVDASRKTENEPIGIRDNFYEAGVHMINGKKLKLSEASNGPPLHPNCRCGIRSVLMDLDE